ncbi:DUF6461 domain-containing protein [Streptomyces sp. NPDC006463]|uniref:DUF6461 domain-containing protein n=1 Tax=Streptomyces sp. NPDC006463 TaxID=3364746 RepID=UPI0036C28ACA
MTKTGADYAWFENDFPDIAEAYCFTLVRGLSPAELVSRLEGRSEAPLQGIAAVVDAAFAQYELGDGDRQLVALTAVGASRPPGGQGGPAAAAGGSPALQRLEGQPAARVVRGEQQCPVPVVLQIS